MMTDKEFNSTLKAGAEIASAIGSYCADNGWFLTGIREIRAYDEPEDNYVYLDGPESELEPDGFDEEKSDRFEGWTADHPADVHATVEHCEWPLPQLVTFRMGWDSKRGVFVSSREMRGNTEQEAA